jgi:serine/threonine protein kinase
LCIVIWSRVSLLSFLLHDAIDLLQVLIIFYNNFPLENVLIDKDGYPVIIDFGFCKWNCVIWFIEAILSCQLKSCYCNVQCPNSQNLHREDIHILWNTLVSSTRDNSKQRCVNDADIREALIRLLFFATIQVLMLCFTMYRSWSRCWLLGSRLSHLRNVIWLHSILCQWNWSKGIV